MAEQHYTAEEFARLTMEEARTYLTKIEAAGEFERSEVLRAAYAKRNNGALAPGTMTAMNWFGWVLFVLGACLAVGAFLYDPSVETSGSFGEFSMPDRIVNNGKLNVQLLLAIVGSGSAICGAIFITSPGKKIA